MLADTEKGVIEKAICPHRLATTLVAAGRGATLLDIVEAEPSPVIIADPVQRREAENNRLRLAISVCRQAGDAGRALRFVLIGSEALKTERALLALLCENPDLATRFAHASAGRLILANPEQIDFHGAFLLHRQVNHATAGDRISLREGERMIQAWMSARRIEQSELNGSNRRLEAADIAADVEAVLLAVGADAALSSLERWRPKRVKLKVARLLISRLLAEGRGALVQAILDTGRLQPWEELFLRVPMAMAGMGLDHARVAAGLETLSRHRLGLSRFLSRRFQRDETWIHVVDTAMAACELLAAHEPSAPRVDQFLAEVLHPHNRQIADHEVNDSSRLDVLFRAHALHSARKGNPDDPSALFLPRHDPTGGMDKQSYRSDVKVDADQRLNALTATILPVYHATAAALIGLRTNEELQLLLDAAVKRIETDRWRFSRDYGSQAVTMAAARSMLVALASNSDAHVLAAAAKAIHRRWMLADVNPDTDFAAKLALSSTLHETILSDIDRAATEIRARRIGAQEKSAALIAYARILLPISANDASVVFNLAVEAASELDHEVVVQLHLLTELFGDGLAHVQNSRQAAGNVAEAMVDAVICLEGSRELPWDEVMACLAKLDLPLALANAAKWHDAGLASFGITLAPVLKTGLAAGRLNPASAMALDFLLHRDHGVADSSLECTDGGISAQLLLEEAAWDALIRHNHTDNQKLAQRIVAAQAKSRWATALTERQGFVASLPDPDPMQSTAATQSRPRPDGVEFARPSWSRETLLNAEAFAGRVAATVEAARVANHYLPAVDVVGWAAEAVELRDRVAFLDIVSKITGTGSSFAIDKLLGLMEQWQTPAVRNWGCTQLPELIVARLPDFIPYIAHGETTLPKALEWVQLQPTQAVDLLLRGIEKHGLTLRSDQVFALTGLIGRHLTAAETASLGEWYAQRLADRVAPADRDQTCAMKDIPAGIQVAVARLLYACMGDFDVRVRWRAAHAVRRLARLGDRATLLALVAEYGRTEETAFRSPQLDFYWIAARLWFAIAWDRVAGESPQLASLAGAKLLEIALDQSFPHVIVQSFARDACVKLAAAGQLDLDPIAQTALGQVARSPMDPQPTPTDRARGQRGFATDDGRRFSFDVMDTVPYWYDPVLDAFAQLTRDQLLATAERWIVDQWCYPGDISAFDAERRRSQLSDRDWTLWSNRHGSAPTLERLNTHLEWHALWCSVGELLHSQPLAVTAPNNDWDSLNRRLGREMLTEPPLWAADIREPVPLRHDFWQQVKEPLPEWAFAVREPQLRGEIEPADRPGYIMIGGHWEITTSDRTESVNCNSALASPALSAALVRALQTMECAWDYGIPSEDHDYRLGHEDETYRMIPWLLRPSSDGGIDEQDQLRGSAKAVNWQPGSRVCSACNLLRDPAGKPVWSAPGRSPMFLYESWGEKDRDNDGYLISLSVKGCRLLVDKAQLMTYLQQENLELVIEVEMRRDGREHRRSLDPESTTPRAHYDRVYRLDGLGSLYAAEGCVGTWSNAMGATSTG